MKKLTSNLKAWPSNLDDVRKLSPDALQASIAKIKPDLSKVRKIAPDVNDLRKSVTPDLKNIQEMLLSLEKVAGSLPDLNDFGDVTKRWGDVCKLVPQWSDDKDTHSSNTLSENEEEDRFRKIQDVTGAPKAHETLQESVKDAKNTIETTLRAFQRVGAALAEAVANANDSAGELSRFSDTWSTHQKEFVKLLRVSRKTASRAQATARKFAFDLVAKLGDDTIGAEGKNDHIREYRANVEAEMEGSEDLAQGFLDLHTQMTYFKENVTAWMKKGDKLKEECRNLAADIRKAREGIEKLTRQALLSASSALGLGFLSAGAVALGIFCPLLWIGAVFSSLELIKDAKVAWGSFLNRKSQMATLQDTEKEMEEKLASLDEFNRIQIILRPALSDMSIICDKLLVISKIWAFIRADLVQIEKRMALAETSTLLFKARLKAAASTYSLLCEALRQYETAIEELKLE